MVLTVETFRRAPVFKDRGEGSSIQRYPTFVITEASLFQTSRMCLNLG